MRQQIKLKIEYQITTEMTTTIKSTNMPFSCQNEMSAQRRIIVLSKQHFVFAHAWHSGCAKHHLVLGHVEGGLACPVLGQLVPAKQS